MLSLRGPEMEERGDRLPPIRQDPVRPETYITKNNYNVQWQRQRQEVTLTGNRLPPIRQNPVRPHTYQHQNTLHWSFSEMPLMLQWYLFNVGLVMVARWRPLTMHFFKQPSLLITSMTSSWNVEIVSGGWRAVPAQWREEGELSKDRLPIEHVHSWKVTFAFKTILISLKQSWNIYTAEVLNPW